MSEGQRPTVCSEERLQSHTRYGDAAILYSTIKDARGWWLQAKTMNLKLQPNRCR